MKSFRSTRVAAFTAGLALLTLAGCSKSGSEATAPTAATESPEDALARQVLAGKAVFEKVCAVCHQANGQGVPAVFPPLAGSPLITEADPGKIIRATLHGLQGPITVNGHEFNSVMPPQGPVLNDADLAAAITYARNSWGNQAPAVTAEQVSVIRLTVKRDKFWTWEELNAR
ncbi:MAG: cytochrome c [Opitutae bacterium]|nr:cytochrome c [Opitutae bacterium]